MKTSDIEYILLILEIVENKFEGHVSIIKNRDRASELKALNWSEDVLADVRNLISLIADRK